MGSLFLKYLIIHSFNNTFLFNNTIYIFIFTGGLIGAGFFFKYLIIHYFNNKFLYNNTIYIFIFTGGLLGALFNHINYKLTIFRRK